MTREEARKVAEVMMTYADGKEIEFKIKGEDRWETWNGRDTLGFVFDDVDYRIKKEPIYRPFKDKDECWAEMQKHQPFGWLKHKEDKTLTILTELSDENFFDILNKKYTFVDGAPFGIKEE